MTSDESLPQANFGDEFWANQKYNVWELLQRLRMQELMEELKLKKELKKELKLSKHDKFTNKTAVYTNEKNYALSLCARKTFYIAYDNHIQKRILFDILEELDPSKRRKNFEFFLSPKLVNEKKNLEKTLIILAGILAVILTRIGTDLESK